MNIRIEDVKPGARMYFGAYAATDSRDSRDPETICWLKADYGTRIISEKVIDYIQFDSPENTRPSRSREYHYGCHTYELSNIYQFLNSDEYLWFNPSHPYDRAPSYVDHPGFLYYFHDYEINSIQSIDLPSILDIDAMPLFKRHGIRPHPTKAVTCKTDISEGAFSPFWVKDSPIENAVYYVGRDGSGHTTVPRYKSGLRPVISLMPETKIQIDKDGIFTVFEFDIPKNDICTEDELFSFLGLR